MLENLLSEQVHLVDDFLENYLKDYKEIAPKKAETLLESVHYSLFTGGKRFRPALTLLTARALEISDKRVLPFASALEMVHTYSLIHDDLPSMDNDEVRRGRPTNHMVYGEALALLAGDALITEAPLMIAKNYSDTPDVATKLVELLCDSAGMVGMIGGQVVDLAAQGLLKGGSPQDLTRDELEDLHQRKTGALIRAAVLGPGIIGRFADETLDQLENYGSLLGLAFQLADDIHDYDPADPEVSGYPKYIGVDGTRKLLEETTERAIMFTNKLGPNAGPLRDIAVYNRDRQI